MKREQRIKEPRKITKKRLLGREEKKIKSVIDIRRTVELLSYMEEDELRAALETEFKRIRSRFPDEVYAELKEYREREKIFHELMEQDKIYTERGEYNEDIDRRYNEQYSWIEKFEYFPGHEDALYLSKVEDFFKSILEKRTQVLAWQEKYSANQDNFYQELAEATEYDFSSLDLEKVEISFSGYAINIILFAEDYDRVVGGDTHGVHFRETVFNFIKQREGVDSTIRHEENHNLSESFAVGRTGEVYIDRVRNSFQVITRMEILGASEAILEEMYPTAHNCVAQHIQGIFHEAIADIDALAVGSMKGFFYHYINSIDDLNRFYKAEVEGKSSSRLQALFLEAFQEMQEKFIDFIEQLSFIFYIAQRVNKLEEAKAAVILYGANNIGKVERYLKRFCPEYKLLKAVHPVIMQGSYFREVGERASKASSFYKEIVYGSKRRASDEAVLTIKKRHDYKYFFQLANLKRAADLFSRDQQVIMLTEQEQQYLAGLIESIGFQAWEELDSENSLYTIRKLAPYLEMLDLVLTRLGVNSETWSHDCAEYFAYIFCTEAIRSDDFTELDALYQLPQLRRKRIDDALIDHLQDGFVFEDYGFENDDDPREIRKTKLWDFLKRVGLEERAEQGLQKYIGE